MQIIRDSFLLPLSMQQHDRLHRLTSRRMLSPNIQLTTNYQLPTTETTPHSSLTAGYESPILVCMYADATLKPIIPSIFTRFNSLTQLVLRSNLNTSINDNDIILITSICPNLTRLKLHDCKQLTDSGIAVFSKNCKKLKKFSCAGCGFSDIGMTALLDNSSQLEVLSIERLGYYPDVEASSLKAIKLASKNLKRLKLSHWAGNLHRLLEMIRDGGDKCFLEVLLDHVVTNVGVSTLSKCRDLIALHIDNVKCTNVGLISVVENRKGLKKLYVRYWNKRSQIGDKGLIAVGKHSVNLEKLILIGVSASCTSLQVTATKYREWIGLEVYRCETITEAEMMCIAKECAALRRLRIEDEAYEASTEPEPVSTSSSSIGFNEGA